MTKKTVGPLKSVRVEHGGYGCECGCCGHRIYVDGEPQSMALEHPKPGSDIKAWARELVEFRLDDLETLDLENIDVAQVSTSDYDALH